MFHIFTMSYLMGYVNYSEEYNILTQLCAVPNARSTMLQLCTRRGTLNTTNMPHMQWHLYEHHWGIFSSSKNLTCSRYSWKYISNNRFLQRYTTKPWHNQWVVVTLMKTPICTNLRCWDPCWKLVLCILMSWFAESVLPFEFYKMYAYYRIVPIAAHYKLIILITEQYIQLCTNSHVNDLMARIGDILSKITQRWTYARPVG